MIRINLLAAERPAAKKKAAAAGPPGALQAYLFLALFGGGALLVCGALWYLKNTRLNELDKQIDSAKKRQQELQAIKAQVDEYEKQKRMLEAKVQLIESLQKQQSGPVHMLDELSKALPDFVWLTSLDQNGNNLRIKGDSNGLTSVADFISNLQHAGSPKCSEPPPPDRSADRSLCYFDKIELISSAESNNIVTFELSANYQNAWEAMKAAAAGTPAGAAATTTEAAAPAPQKKP